MRQAERIADRDDEVTDADLLRIAERHLDEPGRVLHPNEGNIRPRIRSHHFRLQAAVVGQRNLDLVGVLYDVVICQDISTRRVHDHPRARAADLALQLLRGDAEEAPEERVIRERIARRVDGAPGRDIDDGRGRVGDQRRETGQFLPADLRRQRGMRRVQRRQSGEQCDDGDEAESG